MEDILNLICEVLYSFLKWWGGLHIDCNIGWLIGQKHSV